MNVVLLLLKQFRVLLIVGLLKFVYHQEVHAIRFAFYYHGNNRLRPHLLHYVLQQKSTTSTCTDTTLHLATHPRIRQRDSSLLLLPNQLTFFNPFSSALFSVNNEIMMSNSKNNYAEDYIQYIDDNSQLVNEVFPYVEASIGRMLLLLPQRFDTNSGWDNSTSQRFSLEVFQTNTTCSVQITDNCTSKLPLNKSDTSIHPMTIVNDMIQLALECDCFLYHDAGQDGTICTKSLPFSPTVNGLISLSNEQNNIPNGPSIVQSENITDSTSTIVAIQDTNVYITVATILALNILESTIRKIVHEKSSNGNGGSGGAPLLRHMIEQLPSCCDTNNTSVQNELYIIQTLLKGLLLPTGLNLRNILWHGFVGSNIPRPWLSLVLVIIHQLESISKYGNDHHHDTRNVQNASINQPMTVSSSTSTGDNLDYQRGESQLNFPFLRIRHNHPCFSNVVDQGTRLRIEFTKSYATKSDTIPSRVVQPNETTTNPMNVSCDTRNQQHTFDANNVIRSIIPRTHLELWDFCLYQIKTATASLNKCDNNTVGSEVDLQLWSEATKRGRPIIISIILTILMEHALRLLYCQVNVDRIRNDCIARFGSYYITLDGHGQQHQHDLILHPYQLHNIPIRVQTAIHQCIDSNSSGTTTDNKTADTNVRLSKRSQLSSSQPMEENNLIGFLGADVIALLTDLFVSGTGGPNLRAAMAHGLWDDCIQHEIVHTTLLTYWVDTDEANEIWNYPQNGWEIVDVLLATFAQIAIAVHSHSNATATNNNHNMLRYRPSYSFTSSTLQSLQKAFSVLVDTRTIINLLEVDPESINGIPKSVASRVLLVMTATQFKEAFDNVVIPLSVNKYVSKAIEPETLPQQLWSIADTYAEYEMNKVLEPLGAARQLVGDILVAVQSLNDELQKIYDSRREQTLQQGQRTESTRQRNRAKHVAACSEFAHDLYSFALIIAVFSIQNKLSQSGVVETSCSIRRCLNDKEWVKVIERTRMVLSTFSNFLLCNIDRSFKAADQYIKGSLVQKVIRALKVHEEELCE